MGVTQGRLLPAAHSEHKQCGHPGHLITGSVSTHIYTYLHTNCQRHSISNHIHILTKLYYNVRLHEMHVQLRYS